MALGRALRHGFASQYKRGLCLGAEKTRSQPVLALAQGKLLVNRADSHLSGVRFVSQRWHWIHLILLFLLNHQAEILFDLLSNRQTQLASNPD